MLTACLVLICTFKTLATTTLLERTEYLTTTENRPTRTNISYLTRRPFSTTRVVFWMFVFWTFHPIIFIKLAAFANAVS